MENLTALAMSDIRHFSNAAKAVSIGWVFIISLLVTLVALFESMPLFPWSPFIFLHGILTIYIPIMYGHHKETSIGAALRKNMSTITTAISVGIIYIIIISGLAYLLFYLAGHRDDPLWNLIFTYRRIYQLIAPSHGDIIVSSMLFIFVVPWAGIGEELFYRGFVYGRMRFSLGIIGANIIAGILFGLRHSAQLAFLLPHYPLAAGIFYFIFSAIAGSLLAILYERTGSIWSNIVVHTSINLIGFPFLLSAINRYV